MYAEICGSFSSFLFTVCLRFYSIDACDITKIDIYIMQKDNNISDLDHSVLVLLFSFFSFVSFHLKCAANKMNEYKNERIEGEKAIYKFSMCKKELNRKTQINYSLALPVSFVGTFTSHSGECI